MDNRIDRQTRKTRMDRKIEGIEMIEIIPRNKRLLLEKTAILAVLEKHERP